MKDEEGEAKAEAESEAKAEVEGEAEAEVDPAVGAEEANKLSEIKGDTLIKRKKIQLFKFWPKHVLRQAWKKYLSLGESTSNINCAHLAV